MALLQFDASKVEPLKPFEPVPEGWYAVMITSSTPKANSTGTGSLLELEITVVSGEYQGRKLFVRLNLNNPSAKAVEIAYKELSAICHAIGVMQIAQTEDLHNRAFEVRVTVAPAEGKYGPSNDVKEYRPAGAAGAPAGAPAAALPWGGAPAAAAAPAPTAAAPAAAPWGAAPAPAAAAPAPQAAAAAPQPWAAPTPAAAPAAAPAPTPPAPAPAPAAAAWPPDGWLPHTDANYAAQGWYYKGQDVKNEAELKAMYAAPPAAAPTPPAPQAAAPAAAAGAPPPWAR